MNYSLANIIRNERLNLNMSQSELSRKTGIDRTTISRIESGERKKPIIDTLIKLSRVLNIDLSLLLAITGYTSQDITKKSNEAHEKSFTQFIITIKGGFITDANDKEQAFKNAIESIINAFNSVDGVSNIYDELLKNADICFELEYKGKI